MRARPDRNWRELTRWIEQHPQAVIAAVRAELAKPCPHGVPREQRCATCREERPF